jgi:predicted DNA-binding transcriptional regulator AlpA
VTDLLVDGNDLQLWSAARLGKETGLGKRRIYRLHAEGGLPGVRLGGRLWFRPADYLVWIEQNTTADRNGGVMEEVP